MKKSGAFALCVALCGLTVLLGSTREAEAATTTVNAVLQGSSDCNSSCCPSNVQVTVNVDPTTGLWTAQVNGVPVGGNPNNPVPLPVTGNPPFSLRERKVIIRKVNEDPPTETPGPWENKPPSQTGAPGGQTSGSSSRLVDGATDSTANDTEGTDVDVRVEFELTIKITCASGGGCADGACVYLAKWSVTYNDGSASLAPGPY